ncbi:NAC domain containing protein 47 [Forsythia ovata]|uniref:NAC domain containing protein 47 n=1 Tax=Forsythia ovata TaxID=205694 RepID=A0ABD1VLV3_9LAMI
MENQLSMQFDSSNDLIHYLNSSKLSHDEYLKSLPPGFHFRPTEKELIVDYLMKKIKNEKMYPSPIKDVDIYKFNLENIADVYKVEGEREMYFFTPRDKKYKNGQRPKRTTIDGYWKPTGADKTILHNGEAVGCDKSLVFYKGKPPCGVKTSWLMHEFRVNNLPPRQRTHEDDMRI